MVENRVGGLSSVRFHSEMSPIPHSSCIGNKTHNRESAHWNIAYIGSEGLAHLCFPIIECVCNWREDGVGRNRRISRIKLLLLEEKACVGR